MKTMASIFTVLKAVFRNKLRLAENKSKRSRAVVFGLLLFVYALFMFFLIYSIVKTGFLFIDPTAGSLFYFFVLLTSALIVLIFGIINLMTTLYLSKDTDFYSSLPIKPTVVFAAKFGYVYIVEVVIVAAIVLPLVITFGAVTGAWAWFFVITIISIIVVPALPILIAAIFSVPVMFFASKLKNRSIVALVFYILLFVALFVIYLLFIYALSNINVVNYEQIVGVAQTVVRVVKTILYIFYPYTALSNAACGVQSFGLGLGASTVVNLVIFFASSAAFVVIMLLFAKLTYAKSVKANNQIYNKSKAKNGSFKTAGMTKTLIKRELVSAMRSTQVAFQCFMPMLLPIICAVMLGLIFKNVGLFYALYGSSNGTAAMMSITLLMAVTAAVGNGAISSFSREGTALATLKTLPVGIKSIVKAKVITWLIPAVVSVAISLVIVNAMNFNLTITLLSVFSLIPLSVLHIIFAVLWDLMSPKLKWTDPIQAIKHNGRGVVGQLIFMIGGLVSLILIMLLTDIDPMLLEKGVAICWGIIYGELAVYVIVDILMYRRAEQYYNRIEL